MKSSNRFRPSLGLVAVSAFLVAATAAKALPPPPPTGAYPPGSAAAPGAVLGAQVVVANTGDVTATFVRGSGAYSDFLYLDNGGSAWANNGGGVSGNWIFENHLSTNGNTVDLGTWTAGTVLNFHVVADTTGTDWGLGSYSGADSGSVYNWFTGPGSNNSDGSIHAFVDSADFNPPLVGFEDLPGSNGGPPGDANYEDIQYSFSNVVAQSAPDSGSSIALLGISLVALVGMRRRFRR